MFEQEVPKASSEVSSECEEVLPPIALSFAAEVKAFKLESVGKNKVKPFPMNGFDESPKGGLPVMDSESTHQSGSVVEPVQEAEPVQDGAVVDLEPEQDFALVEPRHYASMPREGGNNDPMILNSRSGLDAGGGAENRVQQLELRAIFGLDYTLTVDGILQRANTLAGVQSVALVGVNESAAVAKLRQALLGMGFGSSHDIKMSSANGAVDFLTEGDTTVAVLHQGVYAPGVEEALIVVAREISKLV